LPFNVFVKFPEHIRSTILPVYFTRSQHPEHHSVYHVEFAKPNLFGLP